MVTGASGGIGAAIAAELSKEYQVLALVAPYLIADARLLLDKLGEAYL